MNLSVHYTKECWPPDAAKRVRGGGSFRTGSRNGPCVFLMHGMPGSRVGIKPQPRVLRNAGIRLVSYDRPGYGESDPQPGRVVADCAADVTAIANELEVEHFGVVGRSAGGPHALACAALLAERVCATEVLGSLSPPDPSSSRAAGWSEGMNALNADTLLNDEDKKVVANIREWSDAVRKDPKELFNIIGTGLVQDDYRLIDDIDVYNHLLASYAEAVKKGP